VVVEGVDGEVAAQGVFVDVAEHVVAQQHALGALHCAPVAVAIVTGAEGGHLDHFPPHVDVDDLEAPTDYPGAAEQVLDLLGGGVGGDIEILGVLAENDVPHAAADQIGLKLVFTEYVYNPACAIADFPRLDGMLAGLEDMRSGRKGSFFVAGKDFDELVQHRGFSGG